MSKRAGVVPARCTHSPMPTATALTTIHYRNVPCWQLQHQGQTLIIRQRGAQILAYDNPNHAQPILWDSQQPAQSDAATLHGGIPLCWPWFGAFERNPDALQQQYTPPAPAMHGIAAQLPWEITQQKTSNNGVILTLTPSALPEFLLPRFQGVRPTLTVTLGDNHLQLALSHQHHGQHAVFISQGLHTYFHVSDHRQVTVEGFEGLHYTDAQQDWQRFLQALPLTLPSAIDRLYHRTPSTIGICDPHWQRRITLSITGSQSAVVWVPTQEQANKMALFEHHQPHSFVCIETTNVLDDLLLLRPGEQHCVSLTLTSEAL